MVDLLIKNVKLVDSGRTANVYIKDGHITAIESLPSEVAAKQTIDAAGALLSPGFVDSHAHLDKTLSLGEKESPTLGEACENFTEYVMSMPRSEFKEDIKTRARITARKAVLAGTTTIRTHVNIEDDTDLIGVEALNEVRDELKGLIDIQISALPNFIGDLKADKYRYDQLEYVAREGLVDYLGGAPHLHDGTADITEQIFAIAAKYNISIDLHTDEHDDANIDNFMHTAELTKRYGYEGRVSCGHVTALSAVDDELANKAIQMAYEAKLNVITLPSCNLYLMGRADKHPVRRGITRVRELDAAGVNVSYASDNIRDPFRPIGNADMLEEGLITAQVAQMITRSDLMTIYRMGTVNPARALQLDDYGLDVGKRADLVLIDAADAAEALVNQATRLYVIKNGRVVAQTCKEQKLID